MIPMESGFVDKEANHSGKDHRLVEDVNILVLNSTKLTCEINFSILCYQMELKYQIISVLQSKLISRPYSKTEVAIMQNSEPGKSTIKITGYYASLVIYC